MAPYAYRFDGLGKRAGAAYLNDMIYAASREVSHPLPPVRDLAIVDHMVRTEGADTFQLLVRRRRGDNRCTHHLRDLQFRLQVSEKPTIRPNGKVPVADDPEANDQTE